MRFIYVSFYLYCNFSYIISHPYNSDPHRWMDHRKICPERPRHKFFAHRTMGIQSDFKNNRSKNDGHRRGKHSRRSGSLCRKSSKLLRHSPDIQPMQTSHRICRKKRNGEISDTYNVDASPVLSLPWPFRSKTRTKDYTDCYRLH